VAFGFPQAVAGKRDRRIWLLQATTTFNEMNEPVESFARNRQMWAEVNHISIAEKYDSNSSRAVKLTNFRVQYCTDVSERDRIEHDNQVYKVLGITELGRRELTEIAGEYVEGLAP